MLNSGTEVILSHPGSVYGLLKRYPQSLAASDRLLGSFYDCDLVHLSSFWTLLRRAVSQVPRQGLVHGGVSGF